MNKVRKAIIPAAGCTYEFHSKRYDIEEDKLEYIETVIGFVVNSSDVGEKLKNYLINLGGI